MRKILFSLVALVCSMSMNAQQIKLMKGNTVVATYSAGQVDNVVFEVVPTTGTAKRTGDIEVKWVQLWAGGPKFAEYNVGAANNKAEDYGGYYCWGSSTDKDSKGIHQGDNKELTGTDDTATNLWGSAWRMPTLEEFLALIGNCDVEWTTVNGVKCRKFTGKADPYKSNSVFLPAAGHYFKGHDHAHDRSGQYWSSSPIGIRACSLRFFSNSQIVAEDHRQFSYSVRAVLAE